MADSSSHSLLSTETVRGSREYASTANMHVCDRQLLDSVMLYMWLQQLVLELGQNSLDWRLLLTLMIQKLKQYSHLVRF